MLNVPVLVAVEDPVSGTLYTFVLLATNTALGDTPMVLIDESDGSEKGPATVPSSGDTVQNWFVDPGCSK